MDNKLRVVRSEEEIKDRINALVGEISAVVPSAELTVVGILEDAFVFLADLIRALNLPVSCCFMKVQMHRHGGQTEVLFTSDFDPRGRDILLVSGVVSTGVTFDYLTRHLSERGVKSLHSCALIDKPGARRVDVKPDFVAFEAGEEYLFGYGLGLDNQYRQLPYLAVFNT
ncbi:MAG TPA: phosphoribosyltransferase family protein [Blastocatellia bacterium]|nr:phosphoribosyltransferase family protein [Blastocatellia bacterium]